MFRGLVWAYVSMEHHVIIRSLITFKSLFMTEFSHYSGKKKTYRIYIRNVHFSVSLLICHPIAL